MAEAYEDEKLYYIVNITSVKFPLRKLCKAVFPRKYNTISREYDTILRKPTKGGVGSRVCLINYMEELYNKLSTSP